jgi:activator of 2-hydroxyglutaryl-CoA dehydratase
MVRIAQISCGSEYSGIQQEIEKAAQIVGGSIFVPEIEAAEIRAAEEEIGFHVASPGSGDDGKGKGDSGGEG